MFLNLVVNLSLECPTVLDLAGGEKEFNNRGIGYFFFFFSWFSHLWAPQCMRRKKMRNMIIRVCLLKCVERRWLNSSKMALSYLPSYSSFMPDLHLSHPDSCGSLVYTEMEETRQWIFFFFFDRSLIFKTENLAITSSNPDPVV